MTFADRAERWRVFIATGLTMFFAFATWVALFALWIWLWGKDDYGPNAPSFEVLVWRDAIRIGHMISLPGLFVASAILARDRPWLAPLEGLAIGIVHFLFGLTILGLTMTFGGEIFTLFFGLIYLPLSWIWVKWAQRFRASRRIAES